MLTNCVRCKEPQKRVFQVVVAHKLKANLCDKCYNSWFDARDKLVEEAFRDFLASKTN